MIRVCFILIATTLTLSLYAQEKKPGAKKENKCGCGFQTIVQGGLLEGATGPSWHLQTVNGAYYKTWFAGFGLGLDYYMMRTIPLFLDVRKDLLKKKRTPFLYADAGIHLDWLKSKEKPTWGSGDYNPGFYYDLGLGYRLGLGSRDALHLSMGYTMKKLREERTIVQQCLVPPCNTIKEHYNYTFNRLSFKVGWQLR